MAGVVYLVLGDTSRTVGASDRFHMSASVLGPSVITTLLGLLNKGRNN